MSTAESVSASAQADEGDDDELEEEQGEDGGAPGGAGKKKKKKRKKGKKIDTEDGAYIPMQFRPNIRISRMEGKGRSALASRNLKAGELVFEEEAVGLVVFRENAGTLCHFCGRGNPRRFHEGTPYCTEACLKKHVETRRVAKDALEAVENIAREADVDADLLRMVLLLIAKRHVLLRDSEGAGPQLWQNVIGLMDHREHMTPAFLSVVREGMSRALPFLPEEARIPEDEAVRLACIVNVNSHGANLSTSFNATAGFGIFPLLAILNHSCRPNCAFIFFDGLMKVRVLEDVSCGSELTVPYINLLQPRAARQRELLHTKHFVCTCSRCQRESGPDVLLGALCCAGCGERGLVLASHEEGSGQPRAGEKKQQQHQPQGGAASSQAGNGSSLSSSVSADGLSAGVAGLQVTEHKEEEGDRPWQCSACSSTFTREEVEAYLEGVERAKAQALLLLQGRAYPAVRERLEKLLAQHDATATGSSSSSSKAATGRGGSSSRLKLHPNHQLLVDCLPTLVNCCNNLQDFSAAASYLRRILAVQQTVYPANFPELADYHAALGGALHNHLRPRNLPRKTLAGHKAEIRSCFQRAYEIRRVAMGDEHPLTVEARDMAQAAATTL